MILTAALVIALPWTTPDIPLISAPQMTCPSYVANSQPSWNIDTSADDDEVCIRHQCEAEQD